MVPIHLRLDGHEMSWTFQVEGVAVGFMSVCSQVNLELLHKCFDLAPFHGLCIPHQDDILEPPQEFSIHESSGTVAVVNRIQHLLVGFSIASCDFGALTGGNECMSFYSTLLNCLYFCFLIMQIYLIPLGLTGEINCDYSLEELLLKMKLQYFVT